MRSILINIIIMVRNNSSYGSVVHNYINIIYHNCIMRLITSNIKA